MNNDFHLIELKDKTIAITDYLGSERDVVIPSEIEGKEVKKISPFAFMNQGLTSVVIPETVTRIGESAFAHNKLRKLEIPSSVETIDDKAFEINYLVSLYIPKTVRRIGAFAFRYNLLEEVNIEKKQFSFSAGEGVFSNNRSLDFSSIDTFNCSICLEYQQGKIFEKEIALGVYMKVCEKCYEENEQDEAKLKKALKEKQGVSTVENKAIR
uniref:leucine-rich repeat domain-containing protein n=1 Tax=uncultured Allobacillus sp. TaxID=1638025 RepID=UPI00259ACFC8|nr:leucine-rich repeat domain-containing protein [uncultured Allobacillus sp.]